MTFDAFRFSLVLHIVGLVMWLGGLMMLTRVMALLVRSGADLTALRAVPKRLFFGFVIPGLVLSTLSGVYQVFSRGVHFYMSQGWFHTKLTLIIVLLIVTVVVGAEVLKMLRGEALRVQKIGMLHGVSSLLLLVIVLLTLLGRA